MRSQIRSFNTLDCDADCDGSRNNGHWTLTGGTSNIYKITSANAWILALADRPGVIIIDQ